MLELKNGLELLKKEGRARNFEMSFRKKSGEIRNGMLSAEIIEVENEPCVITVVEDITGRMLAEEERKANLWFLESMDKINQAIQGTGDLKKMLSNVLDMVLEVFDCDRAYLLFPCDPEAQTWNVPMERTRPEYPGALAQGLDGASRRAREAATLPAARRPGQSRRLGIGVGTQHRVELLLQQARRGHRAVGAEHLVNQRVA